MSDLNTRTESSTEDTTGVNFFDKRTAPYVAATKEEAFQLICESRRSACSQSSASAALEGVILKDTAEDVRWMNGEISTTEYLAINQLNCERAKIKLQADIKARLARENQ